MKFKKILCLIMVAMVSSLALIGCTGNKGNNDKNKVKVTMITGVGGINDRSFNQSSWEGLQKAKKDLGVEVGYIESNQDSEYTANIETAVDDGNDLIIGVGFKLKDAILAAAKNYPDQKFAIVDADYGDKTPDNITCITFSEEQAGYVVGLVAGKMTKTNKVGFIGGIEGVVIKRFEIGYKAGVKEANPNAKVIDQYANTFTDSAKGKSIAQQMYANGADIIFSAAGDVGLGAIEVAKEQGKFAIGVDRDQNEVAPNTVITSAMKKVNEGVYNTVKDLKDDKFDGGKVKVYGLENNAVGLAPTTEKNVPKEVIDYVNEQVKKIVSGKVVVPKQ